MYALRIYGLCGAGAQIQGYVHPGQMPYLPDHTPSPRTEIQSAGVMSKSSKFYVPEEPSWHWSSGEREQRCEAKDLEGFASSSHSPDLQGTFVKSSSISGGTLGIVEPATAQSPNLKSVSS